MNVTFHDNDCEFTLTVNGKDTVLQCKTPSEREDWLSGLDAALKQAKDTDDTDEEETVLKDTEILRVFQDIRCSMLAGNLSFISSDDNGAPESELSPVARTPAPCVMLFPASPRQFSETDELALGFMTKDKMNQAKKIAAVATYIENNEDAAKPILLHLDVLTQMGVKLENILLVLGRRHSNRMELKSKHKANVSHFVRQLIFHPHYGQMIQEDSKINGVISEYFAHCRLRHFDTKRGPRRISLDGWSLNSSKLEAAQQSIKAKRNSFAGLNLAAKLRPPLSRSNSLESCRSSEKELNAEGIQLIEPLRSLLWRFPASVFAQQATLCHHDNLARLPACEFLKRSSRSDRKITEKIASNFNRLVTYLVWSVLVEDSPRDRAEVIEQITTIAVLATTPEIQNYHLLMACLGCLGDIPLMNSRLPLTWKKVHSKYKAHLHELRLLCDHSGNFETLRRHQNTASTGGPTVPYIGLIGGALERLKNLPYTIPDDESINFEKFELQYAALDVIEQCCHQKYLFTQNPPVYGMFKTLKVDYLSSKLLHQRSLQLHSLEKSQMSMTYPLLSTEGVETTENQLPVITFRNICQMISNIPCPHDRMLVYLEAMFSDDRINHTAYVRKFWLDFKRNIGAAESSAALTGVRYCIAKVATNVLEQRRWEIIQSSGYDENSPILAAELYEGVARLILQPIGTWIFAKLKQEMSEGDSVVTGAMSKWKLQCGSAQDLIGVTLLFNQLEHIQMPIDMVRMLHDITQETERILRKRTVNKIDGITACVTALANSKLRHPWSVLYFMRSTFDPLKIQPEHTEALQMYEAVLSKLRQEY